MAEVRYMARVMQFQTDEVHEGLPVYRDAGRQLGPDEKTKWEKAWKDGFYTRSALYRLKGLRLTDDTEPKAYVANVLGRLTKLYHIDDAVEVKRHLKTLKRIEKRKATTEGKTK